MFVTFLCFSSSSKGRLSQAEVELHSGVTWQYQVIFVPICDWLCVVIRSGQSWPRPPMSLSHRPLPHQ